MVQQILKEPKFNPNGNVFITRDMPSLTYSIYVLRRLPDGTPINFLTVGKDGWLETKKFDENKSYPLMKFSTLNDSYDWLGELIDVISCLDFTFNIQERYREREKGGERKWKKKEILIILRLVD